jgi:hypothetical protein
MSAVDYFPGLRDPVERRHGEDSQANGNKAVFIHRACSTVRVWCSVFVETPLILASVAGFLSMGVGAVSAEKSTG